MRNSVRLLFALFFLSGFCGLLYQVIWLRKAFAAFGVITPVVSVVVSVFMLGLALGSWLAGRWVQPLARRYGLAPVVFYGVAELIIALGAFMVPVMLQWGEASLLNLGNSDSASYLFWSALWLAGAILPWCVAMGSTFPLMMAFVREQRLLDERSFSFLYLANVAGAMCGTLLTALIFVELFGFSKTLLIAAICNFLIAVVSIVWGLRTGPGREAPVASAPTATLATPTENPGRFALFLLFVSGFSSMGMEVVWTRAFTPVLRTTIYAFAALLAVYLLATWVGSWLYRKHLRAGKGWSLAALLGVLGSCALASLLMGDPRLGNPSFRALWALLGIVPFSLVLGYLTPKLIDEYAGGNPEQAGRAYAINVLGCILGPLLAGYLLLPLWGVKISLLVLAAPFVLLALWSAVQNLTRQRLALGLTLVSTSVALFVTKTYEDPSLLTPQSQLRRDHTATVIATGEGMEKRLLVNGIGITIMTPVTKVMAHLPLAMLPHAPKSALVICFGMGTTFRSLASWGIQVRAVELVPSVVASYGYYHADGPALMQDPRFQVIVDDGRRYLKRSTEQFDVITLDPPPPVEAAGSSLLYSKEFYTLVKRRLSPTGILQQWFPSGEPRTLAAVARSLSESFPHVRAYHSIEDFGYHFLASEQPLPNLNAQEFAHNMPAAAQRDLLEWFPGRTTLDITRAVLTREVPMARLAAGDPHAYISDDRPFNEYCALRRLAKAR